MKVKAPFDWRVTPYLTVIAVGFGALSVVTRANAALPTKDTLRVTATATVDPLHPGVIFRARYAVAAPPACRIAGDAVFAPACDAYTHQRAVLSLEFRFHGVLVMV